MDIGAIPHYSMVFIKVGIRLLCWSGSTARSGYVRALRERLSQQLFTICGVGMDSPFPHNKNSVLRECACTHKSQYLIPLL